MANNQTGKKGQHSQQLQKPQNSLRTRSHSQLPYSVRRRIVATEKELLELLGYPTDLVCDPGDAEEFIATLQIHYRQRWRRVYGRAGGMLIFAFRCTQKGFVELSDKFLDKILKLIE